MPDKAPNRNNKRTAKIDRSRRSKECSDDCCGEAQCRCGDCDDCVAAKVRVRLQRQDTAVLRIESRVLKLLELAITT